MQLLSLIPVVETQQARDTTLLALFRALTRFSPAGCYLCGDPIPPGDCPLCSVCLQDQETKERSYRAEVEQARRPF